MTRDKATDKNPKCLFIASIANRLPLPSDKLPEKMGVVKSQRPKWGTVFHKAQKRARDYVVGG
jgi:hypothetical protein